MSNFKNLFCSVITFDSGYRLHFEALPPLGNIFVHIWYKDEQTPIDVFRTKTDKSSNYYAYLTPEEFAEVLYRVSKEPAAGEWST